MNKLRPQGRSDRVETTARPVAHLRDSRAAEEAVAGNGVHLRPAPRKAHPAAGASALAGRDALRALVETALPIARERASLLKELRGALERGDERLALTLAYRLAGLNPPMSVQP